MLMQCLESVFAHHSEAKLVLVDNNSPGDYNDVFEKLRNVYCNKTVLLHHFDTSYFELGALTFAASIIDPADNNFVVFMQHSMKVMQPLVSKDMKCDIVAFQYFEMHYDSALQKAWTKTVAVSSGIFGTGRRFPEMHKGEGVYSNGFVASPSGWANLRTVLLNIENDMLPQRKMFSQATERLLGIFFTHFGCPPRLCNLDGDYYSSAMPIFVAKYHGGSRLIRRWLKSSKPRFVTTQLLE